MKRVKVRMTQRNVNLAEKEWNLLYACARMNCASLQKMYEMHSNIEYFSQGIAAPVPCLLCAHLNIRNALFYIFGDIGKSVVAIRRIPVSSESLTSQPANSFTHKACAISQKHHISNQISNVRRGQVGHEQGGELAHGVP